MVYVKVLAKPPGISSHGISELGVWCGSALPQKCQERGGRKEAKTSLRTLSARLLYNLTMANLDGFYIPRLSELVETPRTYYSSFFVRWIQ
jgi:hypothetical protein